MPQKYLKIKAKLKASGKSEKAAETSAAKIYNAQRKPGQAPVTGGVYERKMASRKKK